MQNSPMTIETVHGLRETVNPGTFIVGPSSSTCEQQTERESKESENNQAIRSEKQR
jgi:hypothetical protein